MRFQNPDNVKSLNYKNVTHDVKGGGGGGGRRLHAMTRQVNINYQQCVRIS